MTIKQKRTNQNEDITRGESRDFKIPIYDQDDELVPTLDLEAAQDIVFRVWRKPDHVHLEKTKADMTVEDSAIHFTVTQEDTEGLDTGFYQWDVFLDDPFDKYVITDSQIEILPSSQ